MTAQAPDIITVKGETHSLLTNPLEMYREMYRHDMVFFESYLGTACWRGYIAEWEVDDGKLFLLKVNGFVSYTDEHSQPLIINGKFICRSDNLREHKVPATLSELFGPERDRVPATWYTGELRIPQGEMTEYVHHAYASEYSGYLIIPVENGVCGKGEHVSVQNLQGN